MMSHLKVTTRLAYHFPDPVDCLLQVEAAHTEGQAIEEETLSTTPVDGFTRVAAETGLGTRAWFQAQGDWQATYQAEVEVRRGLVDLSSLPATPQRTLPAEVTSFLMPSRYCQSDLFETLVANQFGGLTGGALAACLADWVRDAMTYTPGSSGTATTAQDSYIARRGVCRDFAHVLIALARAGGLPARMASVYAPDVDPPDFHAVAQIWLDGAWHLVDATGMADASEMAIIGVGRDAAEISFLTILGLGQMASQQVTVRRL